MIIGVVGLVLTGFFLYHVMLIYKNITTNEKIKKGRSIKYLKNVIKMLEENISTKKIEEDQNFSGKISKEKMTYFHQIIFSSSTIKYIFRKL